MEKKKHYYSSYTCWNNKEVPRTIFVNELKNLDDMTNYLKDTNKQNLLKKHKMQTSLYLFF